MLAALALVFALAAAAATAALWVQHYRHAAAHAAALEDTEARGRALGAAVAELETSIERANRDEDGAGARLDELDAALLEQRRRTEGLQDLPERLAALERGIEGLPARFADIERRVDAMQGGTADARAEWLRAEARYYLTVANTELDLAGRWQTAARALELADDRLRSLADPSVNRVREQIADELLALASVERPDVEGLVLTLARLAARTGELPLRAGIPERLEPPEVPTDDEAPGLSRLWLSIKGALGGLVRIDRIEERPPPLSDERRALARRELGLELQLARIAALQGQVESFETSLLSAIALLERDFDGDAAAVRTAATLLRDMLGTDVAPARPDISRSLTMLRALMAGDD